MRYEIRVQGHLDGKWEEWFGGLSVTNLANGEALLSGDLTDESMLHGILCRILDLNIPLVSVNRMKGAESK